MITNENINYKVPMSAFHPYQSPYIITSIMITKKKFISLGEPTKKRLFPQERRVWEWTKGDLPYQTMPENVLRYVGTSTYHLDTFIYPTCTVYDILLHTYFCHDASKLIFHYLYCIKYIFLYLYCTIVTVCKDSLFLLYI
jgi:hypothetical protein